tara:strand:+ start:327 stop:461 length:135 start_codon:yes stop_codon:yes gene_type:complete
MSAARRESGMKELNEEEMDIKLAGLDDEDIKNMYPSLRFSSEVS